MHNIRLSYPLAIIRVAGSLHELYILQNPHADEQVQYVCFWSVSGISCISGEKSSLGISSEHGSVLLKVALLIEAVDVVVLGVKLDGPWLRVLASNGYVLVKKILELIEVVPSPLKSGDIWRENEASSTRWVCCEKKFTGRSLTRRECSSRWKDYSYCSTLMSD